MHDVCTYRRVRLVSREKEYSWISRMKLELRFLQKRWGSSADLPHVTTQPFTVRPHVRLDMYHTIPCKIALCNCMRNLQCMNPRPRTWIQLNRYVAKSLTVAADHTGFQFAEAIVWACAALRKLSCNSRQPSARTPAPGARWVFRRSLKLYSVVYFSLCPIWNGQTQRPIVSKLHVGTQAHICWLCIILPQCACVVWRCVVICLSSDDTIDTKRPRPWFLGVTRPRPCELPFLADRKRAFPFPWLHSKGPGFFSLGSR